MEIFKLLGTIAIDNQVANDEIDETTNKAEAAHPKIANAFSKIGHAATVAGKTIAAGLAAGATAMGALTVKALNLSGELEQNMGGSEAVFGDYAGKMQQKASEAYSKMGLSASNYLATANKMGALFKGAGFDMEEASDLASEAMQRAADVASIMGIDTTAAMESIAGAAKGNFTMMDNLGVAMNDTTLQAYALEKGIKKSTQQMTNQEKIALAMEMFLEKTAYAAGNYSKENETLAGALGTAKAALTNFLDGSGDVEAIVESFVNAGEVIVEKIQEILPRLVEGVTQLINQLMPYLPVLIETLLPGVISGATALLTGLITALPQILQILISQIPFILQQIGTAVVTAFPALLETIKSLFGQIWDYISLNLLNTGVSFETAFAKIKEVVQGAWTVLQTVWDSIGQPMWDMIQNCIGMVRDAFSERMPQIKEFVSQCFNDIKNFWNNNLKPCFDAIKNFIENVLAPCFETVFKTIIGPVVDTAFNFIKDLWNNTLKPVFTGITDFLSGVFTLNFTKAFQGIKNIVKGIWDGLVTVVKAPINLIIDAINAVIGGLNKIRLPDWVPLIGGKGINIPLIPKLEEGGILEKGQVGLLEGNGAEAVVPLDQNKAWISAVARDMNTAIGGDNKLLERNNELLEMLIDLLPEALTDAFKSMKFDVNNREFARLVKAVN